MDGRDAGNAGAISGAPRMRCRWCREHFPALQRAPARMAPKAAPIQEIAAAITNRLFIDAGISCIDEEIRVIDAGPARAYLDFCVLGG